MAYLCKLNLRSGAECVGYEVTPIITTSTSATNNLDVDEGTIVGYSILGSLATAILVGLGYMVKKRIKCKISSKSINLSVPNIFRQVPPLNPGVLPYIQERIPEWLMNIRIEGMEDPIADDATEFFSVSSGGMIPPVNSLFRGGMSSPSGENPSSPSGETSSPSGETSSPSGEISSPSGENNSSSNNIRDDVLPPS